MIDASSQLVRRLDPARDPAARPEPRLQLARTAAETAPWASAMLARLLRALPATQTLDAFEVPYVAFATTSGEAHASSAARPLLEAEGGGDLWRFVRGAAVVAIAGEAAAPADGAGGRRRTVPGAGCDVVLRVVRGAAGEVVLAVLLPALATQRPPAPEALGLTGRQAEIARLIAAGETTKGIAAALGLSEHTVRHHTERLFAKLGVGSRAGVAGVVGGWLGSGN